MKKIFTLAIVCVLCSGLSAQVSLQTFYDFSWPDINGDTLSMSQFAGQKVMVVNCASYCVFTPQYTPLKTLQSEYSRYDFTIIGYPSNDFNNQGGTDSAIIATCHNYQVNFPIMSPVSIVTGDTAPLYKWLQRKDLNGVSNATVSWNFNKFLIDRQGHWVRWLTSTVDPLDTTITNWIVADSASLPSAISTIANNEFLSVKSANPTGGIIDLELNANVAQQTEVNLYSMDGRLAGNIFSGTVQGNQQINYSVASLASGLYLLKAQSADVQKTFKIVVAH